MAPQERGQEKQDRDQTVAELREAERLDPDGDAEEQIGPAYEALNDIPAAVDHYEKYIASARHLGLSPQFIKETEPHIEELKARLTPHFITASPPKV